jgi:hypothetical protein
MDNYHITEKEEYDYCVQHGIEPLIDDRFTIDINLRVELQKELFGKDIKKANQRFFKWIWQHKEHVCEECQRPLQFYSATFCSHILSRGAHPEMATDGRNINILCFNCHQQWETGKREKMRIFEKNQKTIELLKSEYSKL